MIYYPSVLTHSETKVDETHYQIPVSIVVFF